MTNEDELYKQTNEESKEHLVGVMQNKLYFMGFNAGAKVRHYMQENLLKAIDKQIAQKPKPEILSVSVVKCPNCNSHLTLTLGTKYCRFCGQAIDRGEADERIKRYIENR